MKNMNPDWEHILWTDSNLPELPKNIRKRCDMFLSQKDYAHVADVLRVFIVNKFGGLYLDVDFQPIGPLSKSDLGKHDSVFSITEVMIIPCQMDALDLPKGVRYLNIC